MIFFDMEADRNGGLITVLGLSVHWELRTEEFPGFITFSVGDHSIEIGEIDNGPGIFYTRYKDGDIAVNRPIIQF